MKIFLTAAALAAALTAAPAVSNRMAASYGGAGHKMASAAYSEMIAWGVLLSGLGMVAVSSRKRGLRKVSC